MPIYWRYYRVTNFKVAGFNFFLFMLIGNGDIASVLTDREDITFFASGVSDSSCSDLNKFKREVDLLLQMPRQRHLVYFSTLARYYAHTPYVSHKKRMELLVKQTFDSWTIVRIGNIDWGTNPHTLINYLKAHPNATVQNVFRHIVSKEEFLYWINLIQPGVCNEMNVPGEMLWVPDIVKVIRGEADIAMPIRPSQFICGNLKDHE